MNEQHSAHIAEYHRQKYLMADDEYRRTRKHKHQYAAAEHFRAWLIYDAGSNRSVFTKNQRTRA